MFITFSTLCAPLGGQDIGYNELDVVGEIERRVSELTEENIEARRKYNMLSVEKIMLSLSWTGFMSLTRNVIFAESEIITVPTDGLNEILVTVPNYSSLVQVTKIFTH